jgi:dihydropyrimidinase
MASTVIKGGTVVTHDLTYAADVRVEGGRITEIGQGLKGDRTLDASGCYVMPGGIDPHTHLEMPFMGTYSADDFDSGTRAALAGGTTMVVDFALPNPGQSLLDALNVWSNKTARAHCDYSFHMAVTWWGQQVFDEMPQIIDKGITSFKHFMAYKGALMVNDDELFASFRRHRRVGRHRHGPCRERRCGGGTVGAALGRGQLLGPRRMPIPARPGRGRGDKPCHHDRRHGGGAAVCRAHLVRGQRTRQSAGRGQQGKRVWGEPLIQHLTLDESEYFNPDWDHAARRVMSPPFRDKRHQDSVSGPGCNRGRSPCVATDHCAFTTAQKRNGIGNFTKIPNGTGGLEDRMPMLWTHGVNTGRLTPNEFVAITSAPTSPRS